MTVYLLWCKHCGSVRGVSSVLNLDSLGEGDLKPVYCGCLLSWRDPREPMQMLKNEPPCSLKYARYVIGGGRADAGG